jgi:hypothetical protein
LARIYPLLGNRAEQCNLCVGIDMGVHHRVHQRADPFAAVDIGADQSVARAILRGIDAVLEGIAVAARRSNLR